jgi:hypothetical protein
MKGLEYQPRSAFKAPPMELIDFRLEKLQRRYSPHLRHNEENMRFLRHPESKSVLLEFKREIPKNEQTIKTIIGFCN